MHTLPYQSTQPYETALNFLNKPSFSGPLLILSWESQMWLLVLELPFTNSETLGKPLYIYRWFSELAKEFVWVFIKCYGKIWIFCQLKIFLLSKVRELAYTRKPPLLALHWTASEPICTCCSVYQSLACSWLLPIAATKLWAPWSRDCLVHHQILLSPWPHTQQINKK